MKKALHILPLLIVYVRLLIGRASPVTIIAHRTTQRKINNIARLVYNISNSIHFVKSAVEPSLNRGRPQE